MVLATSIYGKVLRINLTEKNYRVDTYGRQEVELFLGGRGLGAYFLFKEVPPRMDPLEPENKLIFMNGPLAGTLIPGNNKVCVTFKSPLTNSYSYSLCGGHWGPELKFAGYDGLIIEGKADRPVFIWINNSEIKIKPAENIWGNTIPKTEELIRNELGDDNSIQIAGIGQAGEKLVSYACITAGLYREFGRGGSGAVMGSKNLKGIAISGSNDVKVVCPEDVIALSKKLIQNVRNSKIGQVRRIYGTMELVERINNAGFWVTRNFSEGHFKDGYKLEGTQMREKIISGDSSCFGCPIGCGKWTFIQNEEDLSKIQMEGPEFETVGMLGSNCGISSWKTLLKASKICDTYGLDTINAGACISMAMEAFEKGRLTLKNTDNIELKFGNDAALLAMLEKIGNREGLGNILAKGVERAGIELKIVDLANHSKGQSFPVYDPRGAKAMALTYATSPKGAHHMYATTFGLELSLGNRFEEKGKGVIERNQQFSMAIVDSIALCSSMRGGIPLEDQAEAFSLVTGIPMNVERLTLAAERIINLERMYNVRLGFNRSNDTLPERFTKETLSDGNSKGQIVDLNYLLDDYYSIMGWNSNGVPKEKKLKELGLLELITP